MGASETLDIARDSIWVLLEMAAPVMLVALVVGVVVGLLQALTQIQEMTLVFVPKIIAIFVALIFLLPYMGRAMQDFMQVIADRIASS